MGDSLLKILDLFPPILDDSLIREALGKLHSDFVTMFLNPFSEALNAFSLGFLAHCLSIEQM